jgi:hypothetical protein
MGCRLGPPLRANNAPVLHGALRNRKQNDRELPELRCLACRTQRAEFARVSQGDRVLGRMAGKSPTADVYRFFVRLCESAVLFALKARLTTKAVRNTTTSIAAVETAAAIIAST